MKNFLFLISLFLSFKTVHSQQYTYNHFPDSNASWNIYIDAGECPIEKKPEYQYFIKKDTILNEKKYIIISKRDLIYPHCSDLTLFNEGMIREDTVERKVYLWYEEKDTLLFDYNLEVGDTLRNLLTRDCKDGFSVVIRIDTSKYLDGKFRKNIYLQSVGCVAQLIEGIGSSCGLFERLNSSPDGASLQCHWQNKKLIYGQANCDFILGMNKIITQSPTLFPNPVEIGTSVYLNFSKPESIIELNIYNSLGVLVFQKNNIHPTSNYQIKLDQRFTKGIYFIKVKNFNQNYSTIKFLIN